MSEPPSMGPTRAGFQPYRVTNVEDLTDVQRADVDRLISTASARGVLTGVLCGAAPWDLRPLVLERGVLTIIRTSDPAISPEKLQELRATLGRCSSAGHMLDFGSIGSRLWVRRKYYSATLATDPTVASRREVIGRKLLQLYRLYRASGVVHGHIHLDNIACDGDDVRLLDVGFCYYTPPPLQRPSIAPELLQGVPSGEAADIYGLGLALKWLHSSLLPPQDPRTACLEAMTNPEPSRRPSFEWVENLFLSTVITPTTAPSSVPADDVAAGRVVTQSPAALPEPPPSTATQTPLPIPPAVASAMRQWLLAVLVALVVALAVRQVLSLFPSEPQEPDIPFEAYWTSGQPSYMREVASAAVEQRNEHAQFVIIENALRSKNFPFVRSDLLRQAFDARWEHELTPEDRLIVFKIALGSLLPRSALGFTMTPELHPGVLLALVASVDIESGGTQFERFKPAHLSTLPQPIGEAFRALGALGVPHMETREARALAQIVTGGPNPANVKAFIGEGSDVGVALARLDILKGLSPSQPKLIDNLVQVIEQSTGSIRDLFAWFAQDDMELWKGVDKKIRLHLMLGEATSASLKFEQNADLLRYPRMSVRKEAATRLLQEVPAKDRHHLKSLASVLSFLIGPENRLTRAQTTTLVSGLRLKGEAAFVLLSGWFDSEPDPASVLAVLLARSEGEELDPFNIEAARYLTPKVSKLSLPLSDIRRLIIHKEPLARALGYLKLDPAVPAERQILEDMAVIEPNARMRKEIQERLQ